MTTKQKIVINRVGDPHPQEKELAQKLHALFNEYPDVPAFYCANLVLSREETDDHTIIQISDQDAPLHTLLVGNVIN